ncbi:MAG: hypothetical protein ACREBE_14280, partial [bacterium]
GTMARSNRGAPRSSRASIATPSDTAAWSAAGGSRVGGGPAGGGADEQLTAAAAAIADSTRALTRDIPVPPAAHSTAFSEATLDDHVLSASTHSSKFLCVVEAL